MDKWVGIGSIKHPINRSLNRNSIDNELSSMVSDRVPLSTNLPPMAKCLLYNCSQIDYLAALEWQKSLQKSRIDDPDLEDVLILLEHPPVYTLGTGASLAYLKFNPEDPRYNLHRIDRGGEVTYHCPGQLVVYPILNLRRHQPDLHWYLRQLEEVIIQLLALYQLPGERIQGLTGVWIEGKKVAAIGIKVSRWITCHGFALNICPDLSGFDRIVPCGINDRAVGSMAQFLPHLDPDLIRTQIIDLFARNFNLDIRLTEALQGLNPHLKNLLLTSDF
jgi:lipoyl(octanoyl) transferase